MIYVCVSMHMHVCACVHACGHMFAQSLSPFIFPPPPPTFFFYFYFFYFEKGSFTDLAIQAGQQFQRSSCLYLPSTRVVDMCHHTWLLPRVLGIQIPISSALLSTLVMSLSSFLLSIYCSARHGANAVELEAPLPLKMEEEPNMKKSLIINCSWCDKLYNFYLRLGGEHTRATLLGSVALHQFVAAAWFTGVSVKGH